MELHEVVTRSLKQIIFAVIVAVVTLPILLSIPVVSGYIFSALSLVGLGE
jgi:hypothetical protein